MKKLLSGVMLTFPLFFAPQVDAKPLATSAFCEVYPDTPACTSDEVQCSMCHTIPPSRNVYGAEMESVLAPDIDRPLSDLQFRSGLSTALRGIESGDSDQDGATNLQEITAGTSPYDRSSKPSSETGCDEYIAVGYDVCGYDPVYVFKKLHIDFCGYSPSRKDVASFLEVDNQRQSLHEALESCLDSEFWIGRYGVVWNLANAKIGPSKAIKSGPEDPGPIPLADYFDDYNFFVYTQTDDRSAQDLLIGDYFVERKVEDGKTSYVPFQRTPREDYDIRGEGGAQLVPQSKRAGMLTHRWFLMSNTMFTGIPRTTAAQAYRAYLGYDISRLEGLVPVVGEPVDYDNKDVKKEECAICHSTLDPLSYPFSRYEGIGGGSSNNRIPFTYNPNRMRFFTEVDGDSVGDTPEAGYIFGQPVNSLVDWAQVASASDAFSRALVGDYWELLIGDRPRDNELAEFELLWKTFMTDHNYQVELMLHDFIMTEAYGVP